MKAILYTCILVLLGLMTSGCLKDDVPVNPHSPGEKQKTQIEIGYPYLNQVYYDCGSNAVVSTNSRYVWDLSFECSPEGNHVLLNTAKGVFIAKIENTLFENITSISGVSWLWDAPSGNMDSTAFGNWLEASAVYIVDRQFDANGNHMGYKKIELLSVSEQNYSFRFADLDGSNAVNYTLEKDPSRNFIHFSFEDNGQTLTLEPEKDQWDLLFTNHYHKFSNLPLPFILSQVLSNTHNHVSVAEDDQYNFFTIQLSDTSKYIFSSNWNEIGYDWKIRDPADNSYTIDDSKSYLLKTTEGLFYKLRFIDFYNNTGSKGYPTFEIQAL